jgi:hypothetical protein
MNFSKESKKGVIVGMPYFLLFKIKITSMYLNKK